MTSSLPIRLTAGSGLTFGADDLASASATRLGCREEEGLDVIWGRGVASIQAVLDDVVDVSYGGLGPVLRFRSEGKPVRIILSMARGLAQNLVTQTRLTSVDRLKGVSWRSMGLAPSEPPYGAAAGPGAGY